MTPRNRERSVLAATGALAVVVPVVAAVHLDRRVQRDLVPALARATGQPVAVGGVEAGLTGNLRLRDLAVGDLLRADAVEAAVSLESLLAGDLSADEIRVTRPRIRAQIDRDGRSDWHDLVARLARRRARGAPTRARTRLRRIVVEGGALVIDLDGVRLTARDVELHPQVGGVRLVTGPVEVRGRLGPYQLAGELTRVGADVPLPGLSIERMIAVGGRGRLTTADHHLDAAALEIERGRDGAWRVAAEVDDRGAPRHLELAVRSTARGRAISAVADRVPVATLAPLAPSSVDLAHARVTGSLTAASTRAGRTTVQGTVELSGAVIDHPALATRPVALDGTVALDATLTGGRIDVAALHLTRGGLDLGGRGWARLARGRVVAADATVELAPGACRDLIDALPPALRGPLDEVAVRGTLSGRAHVGFDLDRPPAEAVTLDVELDPRSCEVVADAPSADPAALAGAAEHGFPDGHRAVVGPGVGDWVGLDALPRHVAGAFVAAEDARFWDHRGFDLVQIARSLEIDLREDRFARGGSTISQQLVKNAFLHQHRTLARKLQEAVLTWRLESVLDKRTILARYLNVIELGPDVFGVAAAARHWFGKPAADLDLVEAAFLAALTPAPRTMSARMVHAHGVDPETAERVRVTLRAMRRAGVIDRDQLHDARVEDLDLRAAAIGR